MRSRVHISPSFSLTEQHGGTSSSSYVALLVPQRRLAADDGLSHESFGGGGLGLHGKVVCYLWERGGKDLDG